MHSIKSVDSQKKLDTRNPGSNSTLEGKVVTKTASATAADSVATPTLRLLFVIDGWFPAMGGAELQALNLAKQFKDQGVVVDFVAPHLNKSMPVNDTVDGFTLTKITYPSIKFLGSLWLNLRFAQFLMRNRDQYDAIHIHMTQNLAATAGYLRPFLKIPVVTKISGYYEFENGVLSPNKMNNPIMKVIRKGLQKVDFVQTISSQTEQKLLEAGFAKNQIKTIPNGVQLATEPRRRIWQRGEQFVVGYCGRMQPIKGVDVLIRGFERFLNNNPGFPAVLKIAGRGAIEGELRNLVADLNMLDHIQFVGVIDGTTAFLAECDLYVQPSYAEGLPNSVIEALNAGLPAVVSAIGGNLDLVQEGVNGMLFPAGDDGALAGCLEHCIADPEALQRMGRNAREMIAERYGFDAVTPQLMNLYRHGR